MKVLRNQGKKRPGLDFCDFRLERNSSVKPTFAKNRLLIRISEDLKEQKSDETLLFDEKRASRSTFAPQKSIKIKKPKNQTRSLKLPENQAETRKLCFLNPF